MRLIDADALRQTMYHEAFETDSDMQKWDGGCWIRYKMFENAIESAPTITPDMATKETDHETDYDYQRAIEQLEHDMLYEPTFNPDDGSM